ncbi:MAG: DNA cytosine methyltransferase [Ignavibacteria bacterium]
MKFYSISEISEICKVSQKTIRRQIASGDLMGKRIGNQWRIEEKDFDYWLNKDFGMLGRKVLYDRTLFSNEPLIVKEKKAGKVLKQDEVNWIDISGEWFKIKHKTNYTYLDLFSGAGGLSLGLQMAGLNGIAGVENMKEAVETYKENFKHPVIFDDITDKTAKKKLYDIVNEKKIEVDIVAGGFPCQGFSMSGYRIVDDSRNVLYKEMLDVIRTLKPKFILMENVLGLRSMLGGKVEEKIINDCENMGYKVNVTTLNAANYYVPQTRKRVIFIGNRMDLTNYHPKPLLSEENYISMETAIKDLMNHPESKEFNHVFTKHNKDMQDRLNNVLEGESLYKEYSDAWKKCFWDKPSCTIKENHGGVNIHPKMSRVLTARELARLQSFPDNFIFKGSKKWQLVQIGNAVPPLLGKAIGLALRKSLDEQKKKNR